MLANVLFSHSTVEFDRKIYLITLISDGKNGIFFMASQITPVKCSVLRRKINLDSAGLHIKSSLELILQYDYP